MNADTLPYPRDLTDGVVTLRPHRTSDAEALSEAVRESIATVGHWQSWCHAGYDLAMATGWIDLCHRDWLLGDAYSFLIVDATTDRLLGGMGINQRNREHRMANLGYWVRESAQGRGIATRAGRLAIGFAFDAVGVTRLEIVAAYDNTPSRGTAERLGGFFEGMLRNRLVLHETAIDAAMYSLIPSDR